MGKLKQIFLLVSQIALLCFAGFLCWKYAAAVDPELPGWYHSVLNSNPAKMVLGPVLSIFILLSSFSVGRLLWVRLGGGEEPSKPGASFLLFSATGIAAIAFIMWFFLIPGWSPHGLIFFIMLIALVVEINPTIENFSAALSLQVDAKEQPAVKVLRYLLMPILIAGTISPFLESTLSQPAYLMDPGGAFNLSFGHIPIGLDIPLYSLVAGFAGPWAIPAINLALTWLIIIGMLEISRRLFDSLPAGMLGGILLLCIPFQYVVMSQPSNGLVLAFFLMAGFSELTRFLFEDDTSSLPIAGLFLGIGLSVSARGVPFAAVFLLYALIATFIPTRKGLPGRIGLVMLFILLLLIGGSLLGTQNHIIAGYALYPVRSERILEFEIPEPEPEDEDLDLEEIYPVPAQSPEGVNFQKNYGAFTGVGYKMTMSTDGDLKKGPQGLGPLFMAFIPGILLIMITRRHTKQAWTLILLLLIYYLFSAYFMRGFSLTSLYAIFPFQALLTGYIIDRLYLLSKFDEKRPISYIFLALFVPLILFIFFWTCAGYGIIIPAPPAG